MGLTGKLIAQCINVGGIRADSTGACPTPAPINGVPAPLVTPDLRTCMCNGQTICGALPAPTHATCGTAMVQTAPTIGSLIGTVMSYLYPIAGIILFFVFVSAGYDYIMSYGDPERVKMAWTKMTYGLVGFGILLGAYMIVRVVAYVTGFDSPF